MPTTLPAHGSRRRVVHRPTRLQVYQPGLADPMLSRRRRMFTLGNGVLLAVILVFGMFATGNLPELNLWLDASLVWLRSHNADVAGAAVKVWGLVPKLGAAVLVGVGVFSAVNWRRRRSSATEAAAARVQQ